MNTQSLLREKIDVAHTAACYHYFLPLGVTPSPSIYVGEVWQDEEGGKWSAACTYHTTPKRCGTVGDDFSTEEEADRALRVRLGEV